MSGDIGQLLRILASLVVWSTHSPGGGRAVCELLTPVLKGWSDVSLGVGAALCALLQAWLRLRAAFADDVECCWTDDWVLSVVWADEPILEGELRENILAVAAVSDLRRGASLRAEACDGADFAEL